MPIRKRHETLTRRLERSINRYLIDGITVSAVPAMEDEVASFVYTSSSRGMQRYVSLHLGGLRDENTMEMARDIAHQIIIDETGHARHIGAAGVRNGDLLPGAGVGVLPDNVSTHMRDSLTYVAGSWAGQGPNG